MLYTEERQKQQLSMDFSKRRGEYSGKVGIAEKLARAWRDDALETGPYGERGGRGGGSHYKPRGYAIMWLLWISY